MHRIAEDILKCSCLIHDESLWNARLFVHITTRGEAIQRLERQAERHDFSASGVQEKNNIVQPRDIFPLRASDLHRYLPIHLSAMAVDTVD
ncbi:hypothetical protein ACFPVT_01085 [Corynebacterium choanae]|uniref:hypothetical protein n=1 Tax=Corynebacterium choanae TaxID=1862358 RepID=UPI000F4DCD72|nr:hypothetical protein [Corynebacterium choanae]